LHLRRCKRLSAETSLDMLLNADPYGNEFLLSDILGTEADEVYRDIETEVNHELLTEAMKILSERELSIIKLRFGIDGNGQGLPQREISTLLNISQSYVSRIIKNAYRVLKKEIVKMGG